MATGGRRTTVRHRSTWSTSARWWVFTNKTANKHVVCDAAAPESSAPLSPAQKSALVKQLDSLIKARLKAAFVEAKLAVPAVLSKSKSMSVTTIESHMKELKKGGSVTVVPETFQEFRRSVTQEKPSVLAKSSHSSAISTLTAIDFFVGPQGEDRPAPTASSKKPAKQQPEKASSSASSSHSATTSPAID